MSEPLLPRDAAASFTLPSEIKGMCSLPNWVELYTLSETFRFHTPEVTDPGRTNPNAMPVLVKTGDAGSASPFVARTVLMAKEVLQLASVPDREKHGALLEQMHRIKEELLRCVDASSELAQLVESEAAAVAATDFRLALGSRALERFPHVADLEGKVTTILIGARRAITEICQVPGHFWPMSRTHTSLDHLLSKELERTLGPEHALATYLQEFVAGTKQLIAFRNGQEHVATTQGPRLQVRNFELMPTNQLRHPVWYLDGQEPGNIAAQTQAIPEFLLGLAEAMFVGCVDATLTEWPPVFFERIEEVDPECPMRYRLTIDVSGLRFQTDAGAV